MTQEIKDKVEITDKGELEKHRILSNIEGGNYKQQLNRGLYLENKNL